MSRATITVTGADEVFVSAPVTIRTVQFGRVTTMLDFNFPTLECAVLFCALCDFTWSLVVPPAKSA